MGHRWATRLSLILLAGALAGLFFGADAGARPGRAASGPVVGIRDGALLGTSSSGVDDFLGIPYAKPPIKNLRFRPPQPPFRWRGVRDATDLPSACLQFQPTGVREGQAVSEDCLYLDLYRPAGTRRGAKLPVLVFFHGGGWTQGSGVIYGGQNIARLTHTIVITINYRLGALGWLALPQLDKEQPDTLSGDYGMLDQIQALRWIRGNVAGFGGDPGNVTIDGQSAGAGAVCTMLASPRARGLFAHAIIESLGCDQSALPQQAGQQTSEQFAAAAGCPDQATMVACLRNTWAPDLITAQQKVPVSQPKFGTPVLPRLPSDAIASGHWNTVPVLIGGVRWEGKLFVNNHPDLTASQYVAQIHSMFGPNADAVLARYPLSAYPRPFYAFAAVMTDGGIGIACGVNRSATLLGPRTRVYRYEFNDPTSPTLYGFQPPGIDMSNAHSAELAYLFNFTLGDRPLTPIERHLSDQMIRYWGAFARTGNPNVSGQPRWPRFTTGTHRTLVLRPTGNTVATDIGAEHQCSFWSSLP